MRRHTMNVRIDEALHAKVKAAARLEERSVSKYIVMALKHELARTKRKVADNYLPTGRSQNDDTQDNSEVDT
jgi:hypothetical protein